MCCFSRFSDPSVLQIIAGANTLSDASEDRQTIDVNAINDVSMIAHSSDYNVLYYLAFKNNEIVITIEY